MVKIIYASTTGNTEKVAKYIFEKLHCDEKVKGVEIFSAVDIDITVFSKENQYIVATSTWNVGQMNQSLEELYAQLDSADLTGVRMAFVGLGDTVYGEENFCKAMHDFKKKAIGEGAIEICDPLIIDGDPDRIEDIGVNEWVNVFIKNL